MLPPDMPESDHAAAIRIALDNLLQRGRQGQAANEAAVDWVAEASIDSNAHKFVPPMPEEVQRRAVGFLRYAAMTLHNAGHVMVSKDMAVALLMHIDALEAQARKPRLVACVASTQAGEATC